MFASGLDLQIPLESLAGVVSSHPTFSISQHPRACLDGYADLIVCFSVEGVSWCCVATSVRLMEYSSLGEISVKCLGPFREFHNIVNNCLLEVPLPLRIDARRQVTAALC